MSQPAQENGTTLAGLTPPDRRENTFLLLAGIFIASLIIANVLVFKVWSFLGIKLIAGIIPYPVTFLATDLISEIYGRKRASLVVWAGFVASLWVLVVILIAGAAPAVDIGNRSADEVNGLYAAVFGMSARAIFASMVAYLAAQLVDVHIFHFWRNFTGGRHLWLRNNGSTLVSQMLDTVLVVTILFAGKISGHELLALIGGSYLFKLIIALCDTPFFYAGVALCRRYGLEPAPLGE